MSRLSPIYEWSLHTGIFQHLNKVHDPFTIDRFTTMLKTQLPVYNSYKWDTFSSGVDALAQQDWAEHNNYVNPPFRLIPSILRLLQVRQAEATIIAPFWPAQLGQLHSAQCS